MSDAPASTDSPATTSRAEMRPADLLADLESRQDEVLRLLADLEARTHEALAQLGAAVKNERTSAPSADAEGKSPTASKRRAA